MFVLGIDPGVTRCGFAVLDASGRTPKPRVIGVLTTEPSDEMPYRLAELHFEIKALLEEFSPAVVAIERVLFQVNVRTAMSVGQVNGLVLAEAAARGAEVVQYSPNEIKAAVAGDGGADKEQVQRMVALQLQLHAVPQPADAADAAAVALTYLAQAGLSRAVREASR
jgi:crossover junction endodeoxyribonuclease RuvC